MTIDSAGDPVVDVRGLSKTYRSGLFRRTSVRALGGVSLHARAGEVFGLLGPNGAGKTTMIKILLGVIRATGGEASLFGLPLGSAAARRRVGYLPESLRIDRHHTARTALRYYGRLSGLDSSTIGRRGDELLSLVGLEGRDREPVRRFSKGMLQRLGLAQALMHDPDLLVLDEPTDGLDPVGRSEVRRVIERLRDAGKTIFLNSHILHEVEMVCSHLAIMARGKILASGPIESLRGGQRGEAVDVELRLTYAEEPTQTQERWSHCFQAHRATLSDSDADGENHHDVKELSDSREGVSLTLQVRDQSDLDALVDRIRSEGLSLMHLQRQRMSLEDTFMRLVGDDAAASRTRPELVEASVVGHAEDDQGANINDAVGVGDSS